MNRYHPLFTFSTAFERYILSVAYLYLGYIEWTSLNYLIRTWPISGPLLSPHFALAVQHLIVMVMQLMIGGLLLNSRPTTAEPRNLKEIVIPLIAASFFVTYGFVAKLPLWWRHSLLPANLRGPAAAIGLFLGAAGPILSLYAVLTLGKSFGIFVSVRQVVVHGPYRYVRHPIYLGYFLIWGGMLLANLSPALLTLVAIHVVLVIYRARLEENRLAETSAEYRAYMKSTGFLFPSFSIAKSPEETSPL